MNIDTIQLSHILETDDLVGLNYFLTHAAFVICHKQERLESLLGVLWYLPANSPILVVTNCPEQVLGEIKRVLTEQLPRHTRTYVILQKDRAIAQFFADHGVHHLLGADGRVVDGKGEGMYLGALCALLLGYPEWLIFFDADNFVPSALLEYTLAMGQLFLSALRRASPHAGGEAPADGCAPGGTGLALHNVRICWASKPGLGETSLSEKVLGRCSSVVSPVVNALLGDRFGLRASTLMVSNTGEQGMTIETARALRFSSGYSVETFQLLDLLAKSADSQAPSVLIQQYEARSPHFHQKGDDEHIRKMIAQSLGSFFLFEPLLSRNVLRRMWQVYRDLDLELRYPRVYPALKDLPMEADVAVMERYKLFQETERRDLLPEGEDESRAS